MEVSGFMEADAIQIDLLYLLPIEEYRSLEKVERVLAAVHKVIDFYTYAQRPRAHRQGIPFRGAISSLLADKRVGPTRLIVKREIHVIEQQSSRNRWNPVLDG